MNDDIKKRLGKKIRSLRKSKGLTQEQLGEDAGISYKFVGEMERGEVNPSLDSLIGIAKVFGVPIQELFPGEFDVRSQLTPQDLVLIKKALKLLNKTFPKM